MPHEKRVRDDEARETLDDIHTHLTTSETDVELAEATEKLEEIYGQAINAADYTLAEDTGGWGKVSVLGWCNDGVGGNRNNALFLIEVSGDGANWYDYYRSAAAEVGMQRWAFDCPERYVRVTAGNLAGGGTGIAGDVVDLVISSTN